MNFAELIDEVRRRASEGGPAALEDILKLIESAFGGPALRHRRCGTELEQKGLGMWCPECEQLTGDDDG